MLKNWLKFLRPEREKPSLPLNEVEESVHNLLEFLAVCSGQSHTPSEVLDAVRLHKSLYNEINSENFYDLLKEVAPHYGLRLHKVKRSAKELRETMTPTTPYIPVLWEKGQKIPTLFAFQAFHAGSYKVTHILSKHSVENWLSAKEIPKLLHIQNEEDFIYWIVSEPSLPFSSANPPKVESPMQLALLRIFHLIKLEKNDIWIILIYGIGTGILSLVVPVATSTLVNIVAFGVLLQPVLVLTVLVILFLGFAAVMQVIQTYVVEILQRRVFVRVATEFAIHLPRIKSEALTGYHRPELVNRFFDTMTIQKSINSLLVDGLAVVLTTVIGFFLISFYHPFFLIFAFLILGIGAYFIAYRLGKSASEKYLKVSKEKYKVAAWLEEVARHNALFRSTFGSDFGVEKTDYLTRDYLSAREKYFDYLVRQIIGFLIMQAIASAIVLGLGGYLVIERQLTIGQLVAAELIIAKILSDLSKFSKQLESFYSLLAAMDKIGFVLNLPKEAVHLHPFEESERPIEVKLHNVHYTLPGGYELFSGIHLEFISGSRTVIQGSHPFEAQILMDLIAGFRRPELGVVEYDKQDISEISQFEVNSEMYFARGNEIFEGSVLENLCVGRDEISLLEIRDVLEALGLWKAIQALPKGIHTHMLTFGSPFDAIQSNTLLLARAVLGKPKLLLIDGVLDILPDENKEKVVQYLISPERPWTLILVSRSQIIAKLIPHSVSPFSVQSEVTKKAIAKNGKLSKK